MEEEKRRKKKMKKNAMGKEGFLGLDPPCWLCSRSQLLGAIKS
jgi:hypothetical protein